MKKLPRWVVLSLFAACAVVFAITVWSWSALPDRAMRRFVEQLRQGDLDQGRDVVNFPVNWTVQSDGSLQILNDEVYPLDLSVSRWESCFLSPKLQPQSRTISDFIFGQRRFRSEVQALAPPKRVDGGILITRECQFIVEFTVDETAIRIQPLQKSSFQSSLGR